MAKKKMKKETVAALLKKKGLTTKKKKRPMLWKGPEVDGITQSLLSRFIVCRERFRLLVLEGLKVNEGFNKNLEYGNMWHLCEEVHAADELWEESLLEYATELAAKHPLDAEKVSHWYNVCKVQFPIYLNHWGGRGQKKTKSLLPEVSFVVPYELPSGRIVLIRGKWDNVLQIGKSIWLQENKTKGMIDQEKIRRQLNFDLQTMIYIIALKKHQILSDDLPHDLPVNGIIYNVVRRPLSGGKGSIRRHKATKNKQAETSAHFYNRVAEYIYEEPEEYFMRWEVGITDKDIHTFENQFLIPTLESLCDWWSWMNHCQEQDLYFDNQTVLCCDGRQIDSSVHSRLPYGVYNPLIEGGSSSLDDYLATGSEVGLQRTKQLFPELE
jgi:hypothetical protein